MKFAKLTAPNGEPLWFGGDVVIRRADPKDYGPDAKAVITSFGSGLHCAVREDPQEVIAMLEALA